MKDKLIAKFKEIFGSGGDIRSYFAPGRVNLIGEHTDYNGGHVLPCALTIGTYFIARKREDRVIRLYSDNFRSHGIVEGSLDDLAWSEAAGWANYPLGVMWAFGEKGYEITNGFDILICGNLPNGSGLSSSASVEVGTGVLIRDMYGFDVDGIQIALIGQHAENHFNGVSCGIMDQFAIAMGKKDCAIFLDTTTLAYEYVPIPLKDSKIVIACSNKKRGLGESEYNERREECEEALVWLQGVLNIQSLGELSEDVFESNCDVISSEVCKRRAKHAVYENQRTLRAVEALKAGDIEGFGSLMAASHESLKNDYEVTGKELDTLVAAAWKQEGVIGARMTGAGFGGCTVNIVKSDAIDDFIRKVGAEYEEKIGYAADFYVAEIGEGSRSI